MKVEFQGRGLGLIRTDQAVRTGLPIPVIKLVRERLILLEEAPDEETLRGWRCLGFEKLAAEVGVQASLGFDGFQEEGRAMASIRVNRQWRIVFEIRNSSDQLTLIITSIEQHP